MAPPLLALQDIALTFGTAPLLAGAGISVSAGDRVCLVGRNGSGKSTLLRIAAGLVQADSGRRFAQPGATIRYTVDGTVPTAADSLYEKPVRLNGPTILRARAFQPGFTKSITTQQIFIVGG